jgi:hypothetical protein
MGKKKRRGRPPKKIDPDGFSPDLDGIAEFLGIALRTLHNAIKRYGADRPKHRAGGPYPKRAYKNWADRHCVTGRRKDAQLEDEREVRFAREKLRLERERFEFEQLKEKMISVSQMDLVLFRLIGAFKAAALAFGPRINEQLEGLDFNDRARIFESETAVLLKTLAKPDYLHPVEGDDEELG